MCTCIAIHVVLACQRSGPSSGRDSESWSFGECSAVLVGGAPNFEELRSAGIVGCLRYAPNQALAAVCVPQSCWQEPSQTHEASYQQTLERSRVRAYLYLLAESSYLCTFSCCTSEAFHAKFTRTMPGMTHRFDLRILRFA